MFDTHPPGQREVPLATPEPPAVHQEAEMTDGVPPTGTPDELYDLVNVLYHALQGSETSQPYIDDAPRFVVQEHRVASSRSSSAGGACTGATCW
jgi:hypothetical protein